MDTRLFDAMLSTEENFMLDINMAASIGCEDRVRDLVEKSKISVLNLKNSKGWTPLMYAAGSANFKILSFLLAEGAQPDIANNQGQTALMLAAKWGSIDAVNILIEAGANISYKDVNGLSALSFAKHFGHRTVIQLLTDKSLSKISNMNHLSKTDYVSSNCKQKSAVSSKLSIWQNPAPMDSYLVPSKENSKEKTNKNSEPPKSEEINELRTLFEKLNLLKYYELFETHKIDYKSFWMLCEDDLKELGLHLLGPRKRLCSVIAEHQQTTGSSNNILIQENRQLMKKNKELEKLLSQQKTAAEVHLRILQNFTYTIQHNLTHIVNLEERLLDSFQNLKQMIGSTNIAQLMSFTNISQVVLGIEKHVNEVYSSSYKTLQFIDSTKLDQ